MSPVFRLCDEYLARWAVLDPVAAGMRGLSGGFGAVTDYGPDGQAARAELIAQTLAALNALPVTSGADRLAALFLRERLEAQAAWHAAGEPLRELRAPIGRVSSVRDSVDLLPRGGSGGDADQAWRDIASRLEGIAVMFASWRASLDEGLRRGLPAARRQALSAAAQAERYAQIRTHDPLIASYGDGPLENTLTTAAAKAYGGYAELARYLREVYAPRAAAADGVGADPADPRRAGPAAGLRLPACSAVTSARRWPGLNASRRGHSWRCLQLLVCRVLPWAR
jgi:uncharacterized protein (DUF885 family)